MGTYFKSEYSLYETKTQQQHGRKHDLSGGCVVITRLSVTALPQTILLKLDQTWQVGWG